MLSSDICSSKLRRTFGKKTDTLKRLSTMCKCLRPPESLTITRIFSCSKSVLQKQDSSLNTSLSLMFQRMSFKSSNQSLKSRSLTTKGTMTLKYKLLSLLRTNLKTRLTLKALFKRIRLQLAHHKFKLLLIRSTQSIMLKSTMTLI